MAVLEITKGQEFKVRGNDKINDDNIFKKEYDRAESMLESIIAGMKNNKSNCKNNNLEYENNIIAFCGGRGDGKTSAMLTFMDAHRDKFVNQIVIDPSMFDDVHNILDIVLAELFNDFKSIYNENNQSIDGCCKEKLLKKFQMVYSQVSLINNQKEILNNEYDYEGDIGKLSKLGESTKIKENLIELIEMYINIKTHFDNCYKNSDNDKYNSIIIGIDDLDLCSQNAYKMAEEIRKYLIIPGVVIVMAIRMEQMELCVREKNIKDFVSNLNYMKADNERLQIEVTNMAARYVEKLIPLQRRIYLTKVQDITDFRVKIYDEKGNLIIEKGNTKKENEDRKIEKENAESEKENKKIEKENPQSDKEAEKTGNTESEGITMVGYVLGLIKDKTGIVFLPDKNGHSFLIPNNLRGVINLITFLLDMSDADKIKNLELLRVYFINEWNFTLTKKEINFDKINNTYLIDKNKYTYNVLNEYVNDGSEISASTSYDLACLVKWFDEFSRGSHEYEIRENVYKVRALYSFTLNELLLKGIKDFSGFVNGFIWKDAFDDVIPIKIEYNNLCRRSRFDIFLDNAYETIINCLQFEIDDDNYEYGDGDPIERRSDVYKIEYGKVNTNYIPGEITEIGKRASFNNDQNPMEVWILLGLLLNTKNGNDESSNDMLISDTGMFRYNCQASAENYIVGLATIDSLVDKINAKQLATDNNVEIDTFITFIRENNKDTIRCAQTIVSNIDIAVGILDYCRQMNDNGYIIDEEPYRTMELIELFFDNMEIYLKNIGVDTKGCNFNYLTVPEDEFGTNRIRISYFLASLFEESIDAAYEAVKNEKELLLYELKQLLAVKGNKIPVIGNKITLYPRSRKAYTVKKNIETLAKVIQKYYILNDKLPDNVYFGEIYDLYSQVLDIYFESEQEILPEELLDKYRELAFIVKENAEDKLRK